MKQEAPQMPANPKKISFASASTDTMLKWLAKNGKTPILIGGINDYTAKAWAPGHVQVTASSPVAALRKLCRAVKKGTPDA